MLNFVHPILLELIWCNPMVNHSIFSFFPQSFIAFYSLLFSGSHYSTSVPTTHHLPPNFHFHRINHPTTSGPPTSPRSSSVSILQCRALQHLPYHLPPVLTASHEHTQPQALLFDESNLYHLHLIITLLHNFSNSCIGRSVIL